MRGLAFCVLLAAAACDDHGGDLGELQVVLQDDASDEAFLAIYDRVQQGDVTVNDARAAELIVPAEGSVLTAGVVPTFGWGLAAKLPHGVASGTFVWLELSGAGLAEPLHVVSIATQSWTPTAEQWTDISDALGPLTVKVTTTVVDDAVVREGPFRPSVTSTYQVVVN